MVEFGDGWHPDYLDEHGVMELGLANALGEITRAGDVDIVDPLERILSPDFTEPLWDYEGSRIDPLVPGNLHAKQFEVLKRPEKHRWLFWANQAGKTTIGAIDTVLLALGRHPWRQKWEPPLVIWASALTWDLWENVLLPELLTWIPDDRIIDAPEPFQKSTKRVIKVLADNGKITRIEGKSAEQGAAKYQSRRLHHVWFDEEHPESIYDEVLPRLVRHGGRTITTATPLKGLTWIYDRVYRPWKEARTAKGDHWCSHAGMADNPGIQPEEVDALRRELVSNPALLAARLEGLFMRPQGLVLSNLDPDEHLRSMDDRTVEALAAKGKVYGAVDFGYWRFAFLAGVVDRAGRMHIVEEIFSQQELLDVRAKKMHDCLVRLGAPRGTLIWGDAANPQDILELNSALAKLGSPYRVQPVGMENKLRKVGAERVRNLIGRGALLFRRELGAGQVWRLGASAAKSGVPVEGSRALWETNNWSYPTEKNEEKHQKDDPDDSTADGADMMAALRYLIMSWWKGPTIEVPPPKSSWEKRVLEAEAERSRRDIPPPRKRKRGRRW